MVILKRHCCSLESEHVPLTNSIAHRAGWWLAQITLPLVRYPVETVETGETVNLPTGEPLRHITNISHVNRGVYITHASTYR